MPYDTGPDNDFLDTTPKAQATKSNHEMDIINRKRERHTMTQEAHFR